jgi:CheY-like chemotaxis protein
MSPLRILLLEDNANDAELIQALLEIDDRVNEVIHVQTRAEFVTALETGGIELILADYKLPSFDGLSALKLALIACPDVPFIFVSGALGEELAIEALKIGATDYVLKTRLSRLVPAVERALREARERAERKKAEEALRRSEMYLAEAQRLSQTGSFGWNVSSGEIYWSDETYRIFACDRTINPSIQLAIDRTHPDDRRRLREILDRAAFDRAGFTAEHRLMMADGSVKYVRSVAHGLSGENPSSFLFVGAITDNPAPKASPPLVSGRLQTKVGINRRLIALSRSDFQHRELQRRAARNGSSHGSMPKTWASRRSVSILSSSRFAIITNITSSAS